MAWMAPASPTRATERSAATEASSTGWPAASRSNRSLRPAIRAGSEVHCLGPSPARTRSIMWSAPIRYWYCGAPRCQCAPTKSIPRWEYHAAHQPRAKGGARGTFVWARTELHRPGLHAANGFEVADPTTAKRATSPSMTRGTNPTTSSGLGRSRAASGVDAGVFRPLGPRPKSLLEIIEIDICRQPAERPSHDWQSAPFGFEERETRCDQVQKVHPPGSRD